MPATYEPIATATTGSATSSINFGTISSSYTDLRVVVNGTMSGNVQVLLRFNSDSASNYGGIDIDGDGASASSNRYSSDTGIYANWSAFITSAQPFLVTYDVFSYNSSSWKTVIGSTSQDRNGSGFTERNVGIWRSTSAITSVAVIATGSTFATGTTATLYGILKA